MNMGGVGYQGPFVTGVPYSATQVQEHTRTLLDGTHISQEPFTTLVYRDSQGRTRREQTMFPGRSIEENQPMIIQIQDPVAGFKYVLDVEDRIAYRAIATRPPSGVVTVTAPVQSSSAEKIDPAPALSAAETQATPTQTSESLGTQNLEGVTVRGYRITTIVPVGVEGNDRPLVSTYELWKSRELGVTVLSKSSDPLNGETITRLTKIIFEEPDPTLFQPPRDYKIVDEPGSFTIHYTRPSSK